MQTSMTWIWLKIPDRISPHHDAACMMSKQYSLMTWSITKSCSIELCISDGIMLKSKISRSHGALYWRWPPLIGLGCRHLDYFFTWSANPLIGWSFQSHMEYWLWINWRQSRWQFADHNHTCVDYSWQNWSMVLIVMQRVRIPIAWSHLFAYPPHFFYIHLLISQFCMWT